MIVMWGPNVPARGAFVPQTTIGNHLKQRSGTTSNNDREPPQTTIGNHLKQRSGTTSNNDRERPGLCQAWRRRLHLTEAHRRAQPSGRPEVSKRARGMYRMTHERCLTSSGPARSALAVTFTAKPTGCPAISVRG